MKAGILKQSMALVLSVMATFASAAPDSVDGDLVQISMVNHAHIEIAQSSEKVWQKIKNEIAYGDKFVSDGFVVRQIKDDPTAILGGIHIELRKDGKVLDERIAKITEMDEQNQRFSLFATYMTPPFEGMTVNASYYLTPTQNGVRYSLDAYAQIYIPTPEGANPQKQLADYIETATKGAQQYLDKVMRETKKSLEAQ